MRVFKGYSLAMLLVCGVIVIALVFLRVMSVDLTQADVPQQEAKESMMQEKFSDTVSRHKDESGIEPQDVQITSQKGLEKHDMVQAVKEPLPAKLGEWVQEQESEQEPQLVLPGEEPLPTVNELSSSETESLIEEEQR